MPRRNDLAPFSEELIVGRLKFENPWWVTAETDEFYQAKKPRLYFSLFQPLVEETAVHRGVVLMGPRRVGKTVMMHHSIQQLLRSGVSPRKICFINIENPIYNNLGLERLFQLARIGIGSEDPAGWFVFFDEIQYLKDWEVHLKVLVDSFPKTKFIASGSAAATLKMKSRESGAGRFTDFLLPPLTFAEYIDLKGLGNLIIPSRLEWNGNPHPFVSTVDIDTLNGHFVEYMNFGGYPEVIFSEAIRSNPGRFIRSDIVDKVLLRDLPSLYGISDVQELNSLFTTLAYNTGNEVSLEALTKASGVDKNHLRKYLEYLEAAFLIRAVHRIDDNSKRFRRMNFFKIFLTNPSLRSALFAPLNATDEVMGNLVETTIFAQWMHREGFTPYYARWRMGEVDMVGLDRRHQRSAWALEIKWSDRYFKKPGDLKGLLHFCRKNELNSALATTISKEGTANVSNIELIFVPSSIYAYIVGKNTLEQKHVRTTGPINN
ncbi:MAG: ATP-binding protein [Acidobacteria bacterium]|nr:ATP-binding protein [Acidobacteriota bacterium]